MTAHFARCVLNTLTFSYARLNQEITAQAHQLPVHRAGRFLTAHALLAEMLVMLYGIQQLPEIIVTASGRPSFRDPTLPDFSMAVAGNIVGVLITSEGPCGLDMTLRHHGLTKIRTRPTVSLSHHEATWIAHQSDRHDASAQIRTLHHSIRQLIDDTHLAIQLQPAVGRLQTASSYVIEAMSDIEDILVWGCAVSPEIDDLQIWQLDAQHTWHKLLGSHDRWVSDNAQLIRLRGTPSTHTIVR